MNTRQEKPYKGPGMDGKFATWYAKSTKKDIAEFRNLADRLSKETGPRGRILEVAPGPGYLAIELAKRGQYEIVGLDISKTFVQIAKDNALKESVSVDFRYGNASAMPFDDNGFDLVVCRAAFKNFSQPVEAINEMFRVLKPGGRAIIIDLRKDASYAEISSYVKNENLNWFDSMFTKLTLRFFLVPWAHSADQFKSLASSSRFCGCEIDESGISLEVTLKKGAA